MVELVKQNYEENVKQYKNIELSLRSKLSKNVTIAHVGSTAIADMYGKNIIDVLIGADDVQQFNSIRNILIKQGFIPSDKSRTDVYQFFASEVGETTAGDIHLHLVMKNTDRYDDFIVLRDYLLKNNEEVKAYSDFKLKLINSGVTERKDYKRIKGEYVTELIVRAKKNKNTI